MKGADDMRFMALQPKQMLSFDWNAPPHLPAARQQRTFVVVRFAPVSEKETRVSLHHTGWGEGGEWDKTYAYFDRAWGNVLANLKKRFESGPAGLDRVDEISAQDAGTGRAEKVDGLSWNLHRRCSGMRLHRRSTHRRTPCSHCLPPRLNGSLRCKATCSTTRAVCASTLQSF